MSQLSQNPTTQKPEFTLGYRPELDGVRGISILLVLCLHLLGPPMPGGYLGVDIFFVLSGFLITSLLLQEWRRRSSISLKDFYIRRALRLGPALITYLLSLGVFALVFLKRDSAKEIYTGILLTLSVYPLKSEGQVTLDSPCTDAWFCVDHNPSQNALGRNCIS